ncbi:hypothetical protein [Nocardia asiatica]|uniref:hypothetical protein n=1 Tax=Nocardia asiatica TaxID=209252 RepID=UPI00030F0317|nr:hypothetical protein [Nocardia asiatica]
MNGEVRLDPDRLRNRGARLSELGDRVGQTYTGLRDSLAHAEGSWGDDDLGLAFAKEFKPHADQLLVNLRAMQESLHSTAAGIRDAADHFEVHDRYGASRVGTAAEELQPIGESALPSPVSDAGTSSPAATFPAAAAPAQPTDRADSPRGSIPEAARTPDTSAGRSTPEGGPQRNPSEGAGDRGAAGPGSGNSGKPAGDSGRRPPDSGVFPPAAARDSSRAPAARQPGAGLPDGVGRRDTPWSGQPPRTAAPPAGAEPRVPRAWAGQPPRTAGPPAGAEPRPPGPRFGSPPRPQNPAGEAPRGRDRRRPEPAPVTHPVISWLARILAEHHGVRVEGFDTPGLRVPVMRGFVAAVDRVLTDYPVIALDVVAVAELDAESRPVWWSHEPRDTRGAGADRSITLDQQTALESSGATKTAESDAGSAEQEIHLATLREFGRALDFAGGGRARRQAQRVLIAEYLRLEAGPDSTFAEVVRGYRRWRSELAADTGEFEVGRAIGAAFADVVLRGDEASPQARALHAVLVDATSRRG